MKTLISSTNDMVTWKFADMTSLPRLPDRWYPFMNTMLSIHTQHYSLCRIINLTKVLIDEKTLSIFMRNYVTVHAAQRVLTALAEQEKILILLRQIFRSVLLGGSTRVVWTRARRTAVTTCTTSPATKAWCRAARALRASSSTNTARAWTAWTARATTAPTTACSSRARWSRWDANDGIFVI
jgi:hypothetical protein